MTRSESPLQAIDRVLAVERDLDQLAHRALEHIKRFLPVDGGAALIYWDESSGGFRPGATSVSTQNPHRTAGQVRTSGGASRWIVEQRVPFSVADVREDPFGANPMLLDAGNHAYLGAPLLSGGGRVEGVLYAMRQAPGDFSQAHTDALMVLAGRVAGATSRIREARFGIESVVHMLVVDDDPELRRTLSFILGRFPNVEVHLAATSEAAERLAESRPDLLLLDIDLQGDTGPELYTRIRHLWGDDPPDVWFMTGRDANVDRARDESLGARGTLLKPLSLEKLRSIVDEARRRTSPR